MGDTIEFTVWPRHHGTFYRITSSAISFDVKASGDAVIGLSTDPETGCRYWVCIGDSRGSCTWIAFACAQCHSVSTPQILSGDEYRRFWLTWFNGIISLGRHGDPKPIISQRKEEYELNYIIFTSKSHRLPVLWRLELPPQYKKSLEVKPLTDGKPEWVDVNTQLPDGAIIGGFENETLYIVRAHHRGSLTPGKFVPSEGVAYVPWGGQANEKNEFQVLCGIDYTWVSTWENRIPVGAVEGGYSEVGHETLFVGRAYHQGYLIPGKVSPSHKVCYIPYQDQELAKKNYEILVQPLRGKQYANKMYVPDMHVPTFSEQDGSNDSDQNEDDENDHLEFAVAF